MEALKTFIYSIGNGLLLFGELIWEIAYIIPEKMGWPEWTAIVPIIVVIVIIPGAIYLLRKI